MDSLEYQKCLDDEENHDVVDLAGRPDARVAHTGHGSAPATF